MSGNSPEQPPGGAGTPAATAPGRAAYELGFRSDEELFEIVKAAKHYDHENRPRGQNWGSVPDWQAARLIIGALRAMQQRNPSGGRDAQDGTAHRTATREET